MIAEADGFVALGITCLTYAAVESAHGYGFIGVFVAALALRSTHRSHAYHTKMHDYAEELERLLMMVLLVGFGAALVGGGLLQALTWHSVAFALLALFVVRPLSGWLSLVGSGRPASERAVVGRDQLPHVPVGAVGLCTSSVGARHWTDHSARVRHPGSQLR